MTLTRDVVFACLLFMLSFNNTTLFVHVFTLRLMRRDPSRGGEARVQDNA